MLDPQLAQAFEFLEQIGIDVAFVVAHGVAAFVILEAMAAPQWGDARG
jgi:hypothetical protein